MTEQTKTTDTDYQTYKKWHTDRGIEGHMTEEQWTAAGEQDD
ncbi:hypothetical protein [Amycolatopsis sp. WAC 04182]|nr:hypothetical protein [Amycolatopsis sp. WAC 04182]